VIKTPKNLVIFGAVAAAALVIPGMLGPLIFQQAEAQRTVGADQSIKQAIGEGVINAQVGVQVGNVCVQALAADSEQCVQE
jgi:uncharacterized membrane protein